MDRAYFCCEGACSHKPRGHHHWTTIPAGGPFKWLRMVYNTSIHSKWIHSALSDEARIHCVQITRTLPLTRRDIYLVRTVSTSLTFECCNGNVCDKSVELVGWVFVLVSLPVTAHTDPNWNISGRENVVVNSVFRLEITELRNKKVACLKSCYMIELSCWKKK